MEQINEQNPVMNQDAVVTPPEFNNYQEARPRLTFKEAVKICWSKYADFTGRARRSEYWWFCLFTLLVMLLPLIVLVVSAVGAGVSVDDYSSFSGGWFIALVFSFIILMIIALVFLVPSLAVTTRRLHDTGRSGWWIVVSYAFSVISSFLQGFVMDPVLSADAGSLSAASKVSIAVWGVIYLINLGLSITVLVFTLLDSHKGENKYGPSPKYQ